MNVRVNRFKVRHLVIVASLAVAGISWMQSPAGSVESVTKVSWERADGSIDPSALDCKGNVVGVMLDPFASGSSWIPKTASGTPCVSIQTRTGSGG